LPDAGQKSCCGVMGFSRILRVIRWRQEQAYCGRGAVFGLKTVRHSPSGSACRQPLCGTFEKNGSALDCAAPLSVNYLPRVEPVRKAPNGCGRLVYHRSRARTIDISWTLIVRKEE